MTARFVSRARLPSEELGAPLASGTGAVDPPPSPFPRGTPEWISTAVQWRNYRRTVVGLGILAVGSALFWVPFLGAAATVVLVTGVVLLLLGRMEFGPAHRRCVESGGLLLLGAAAANLVVLVLYLATFLPLFTVPTDTALTASFSQILVGGIVTGALFAAGCVALPFALADRLGRGLLVIGLALQVVVSVVTFSDLAPVLPSLAGSTFNGSFGSLGLGSPAAIDFLGYQLLGLIPSAFFGVAYYRVWRRIDQGEFPPPLGAARPIVSTRSA